MAIETALSSASLLDSFGVATHIDYTDGAYASIDKTLGALNYLGLNHVRDASPTPKSDAFGQGHLGDAASAGIKFTFLAQGGENPQDVVARLHQFISDHPGSITAIEGPNEVNNWQVNYNGLSGTAGAQAYQEALFTAVNADPLLKSIPVLGFTDYPFNASASDFNNLHPYANSGDQPRDAIVTNETGQAAVDPGKGFMITEFGYQTAVNAPGFFEGVDQTTQAKLTLNALMDAADLGSARTFLYELLDEQPDPAGTDQQAHFGLFNFDGTPKIAASAIHNLTSILSDPGAAAQGAAAGTLDYSIQGLPADGHTLLTAKSDGSFQIIAWNEPDVWDENANHAISPAAIPAKLQLGQTFDNVQVFDPLVGATPIATYASVSSIDLSLDGHPLVVQVSNGGGTSITNSGATLVNETPVAVMDSTTPVADHTVVSQSSENSVSETVQHVAVANADTTTIIDTTPATSNATAPDGTETAPTSTVAIHDAANANPQPAPNAPAAATVTSVDNDPGKIDTQFLTNLNADSHCASKQWNSSPGSLFGLGNSGEAHATSHHISQTASNDASAFDHIGSSISDAHSHHDQFHMGLHANSHWSF